MKNLVLLLIFALSITTVQAQVDSADYKEATATIQEIDSRITGRRSSVTARVNFTTQDGQDITTIVRLAHIPLLGSFKDVGDEIKVLYDPTNPGIARSEGENFLQTYGIYLMVGVAVLFWVFRLMKRRRREAASNM